MIFSRMLLLIFHLGGTTANKTAWIVVLWSIDNICLWIHLNLNISAHESFQTPMCLLTWVSISFLLVVLVLWHLGLRFSGFIFAKPRKNHWGTTTFIIVNLRMRNKWKWIWFNADVHYWQMKASLSLCWALCRLYWDLHWFTFGWLADQFYLWVVSWSWKTFLLNDGLLIFFLSQRHKNRDDIDDD